MANSASCQGRRQDHAPTRTIEYLSHLTPRHAIPPSEDKTFGAEYRENQNNEGIVPHVLKPPLP